MVLPESTDCVVQFSQWLATLISPRLFEFVLIRQFLNKLLLFFPCNFFAVLVKKLPTLLLLLFETLQVVTEFQLRWAVAVAASDQHFCTATFFQNPLDEFEEVSACLDAIILDQMINIVEEE